MSVLKVASRKLTVLLSASVAVFAVACSGAEDHPIYASTDIGAAEALETGRPIECEAGSVQDCTIWLGQHGDLSNCVHGLDVCADGVWTGCIDETTLSENPELYSAITAAQ